MIALAILVAGFVVLLLGVTHLSLKHIQRVAVPDVEAHARLLEEQAMRQERDHRWEEAEKLYTAARKVRTRLLHARQMLEHVDGDFLPLDLICLVGTEEYRVSTDYVEVNLKSTNKLGEVDQFWGRLKLPLEFSDLLYRQKGRVIRIAFTTVSVSQALKEAS